MAHIHQEVIRSPGPTVIIDCPNCLGRNIKAASYDQQTKEKLYGLFNLHEVHSTWVTCSKCRTSLRSSVDAASLADLTPGELTAALSVDAGFIRKATSVVALCLAIVPVAGTIVAAISLAANWKLRSWPRFVSLIALIGSIAVPVLMICVGLILHAIGA